LQLSWSKQQRLGGNHSPPTCSPPPLPLPHIGTVNHSMQEHRSASVECQAETNQILCMWGNIPPVWLWR
jgi:hypothetical protein